MNNKTLDYAQNIPDRFNPFNNDTENISYRDDYRKIVPQISMSGCIIPKVPSKFEKRNIKSVYNKTSLTLIFHLILTNIIASVFSFIVTLIAIPYVETTKLESFLTNTSIYMDIIAITYTITNVCTFLLGCKLLRIPIRNVFNSPKIDTLSMTKHIIIAWCLQGACMIVVTLIYSIFSFVGINLIPENALTNADYSNVTYCIATFLYSCIIAPITEEMVFRGVILRGFSTISQRFGIFMSALLFGLLHGNILQFITTFTVGIYLGFIATKYNSIIPTIVIHFFINLIPTIMEMLLSNNEFVYYGFYAVMIILGIILICLGIKNKSNRLPLQNEYQKQRTLPIALSSTGVLTILLLYVLTMIINHVVN